MNKIYKVIWSQITNSFIAVSELASSRGKTKSTTNNVLNIRDKNSGVFKLTKIAFLSSMLFVLPNNATAVENVEAANLTVTGTSTFTGAATFNGGITANGKNVATSDQIDTLNAQLTTKADSASVTSLSDKVNALENQKANTTDVSNLTNKVNSLETNKADKSTLADLTNTVTNNQNQFTALKTLFDSLGVVTEYNGIKYFRVKSTETDARATGSNSLAAGPKSDAKAEKSVTVGYDAYAENSANKGIAIGNKSQVGSKVVGGELTYDGASEYVIGDGSSSIAIGDSAVARGNSNIALGKNALTTNKDAASLFSSNNIAVGTESKTIAASNAIAFGNQAVAGGKGRVADSSIAIGDNAKALDLYATAIGRLAEADRYGLAIGSSARAAGEGSVALGQESLSNSQNTVAIGKGAQALPWRTISIGQDAGKGQAADIVGDKNEQINIGVKAGENVDGQLNIGIGQSAGSNVLGKGNIALGQNAGQFVGGTNSSVGNNIAIGTNANKYATNTDVVETTAIGFGAQASGTRTVALGKETKATAIDSVAIGTSSQANGASSVAIGLDAIANGSDNLALGHSSKADTKAGTGYLTGKQSSTVVSVGNDTLQRRIVNVADGADDQDAVTVAQLKRVSDDVYNKVNTQINNLSLAAGSGINYDAIPRTATENSITLSKDGKKTIIGSVAAGTKDDDAVNLAQLNQVVEANKVHYFSTKVNGSTLGNYNNNGAEGDIALAVGMDVRAVGDRSVTVGNRSTAESRGGIAIGALYDGSATLDDNDAQNAVHTVAKSSTGQPFVYNMAIGAGASSEGNNSIAIGSLAKTSTKQQNTASPDRAIALGYFAAASDVKANAIGDRATSSGQKANAFGSQATATAISATAIGTVAQAQGENSIAMGTHQRVTGINSGSIGYAGAFDEEVKGRSISGSHAGNATQVSGSGTYSVGNTNSNITSNESGIFGNDNFVQAKENIRVVGNTNTISKRATPTVNTGAPPITTSLKDVYITGHNNQVDSAEKPLENSKNLFVVGAANKIGTVLNGDKALTITDSYVIGTNNTINTSNTASGSLDPSNPAENGTEAADKNKVGKGFFILGNNVTATKENSVYLGTDSAYIGNSSISAQLGKAYNSQIINGKTYNYAGGNASGVVTVGHSALTRRIQGVAAGLVNATSTDAINGSQLYAHTRPLGFAADNTTGLNNKDGEATATTNLIQRASGQAIEILGGADKSKLSNDNIGVNVKDTNTIEVKLAKNINLGNDGSVTIGNTEVNNGGVTIKNPSNNANNVTLT
ncbi:TPA: ESPR-type extended signal peptide-containing protein, partial [Mannheimia haemolytica]